MNSPDNPNIVDAVKFFSRHLIPLHVTYRKGDQVKSTLYSTFVLSIHDQWILVTAGHCVEEMEEAQKHGYKIERARLVDSMGHGAKFFDPIPFDLPDATPIKLFNDEKYDYGLIFLQPYYRNLLERNGIKALTETWWKYQPDKIHSFLLVGAPKQLSNADGEVIQVVATLHPVKELKEPPVEFEKTDAPTFFGWL